MFRKIVICTCKMAFNYTVIKIRSKYSLKRAGWSRKRKQLEIEN